MSDQGKSSGDSRKSSGQSQKRQNAPAAENTNSHQRHHKKFSQSSLVPCYVENRRKRPLFSDKKVWIDGERYFYYLDFLHCPISHICSSSQTSSKTRPKSNRFFLKFLTCGGGDRRFLTRKRRNGVFKRD